MTQRASAGSAIARRRRTSCVKTKTFTTVNDIDRVLFARGAYARVRGDGVRKKVDGERRAGLSPRSVNSPCDQRRRR